MIVDWEDLIDRDDVHGSMRTIALVVTYFTGQEITIKRKIHEAIAAGMFREPFGLNPKGVTLYSRILARGVKTLMGEESEGVYVAMGQSNDGSRTIHSPCISSHMCWTFKTFLQVFLPKTLMFSAFSAIGCITCWEKMVFFATFKVPQLELHL